MRDSSTYFAPIGSGIGDVVVALPALAWLVEHSGTPVFLVARGPRQLGFDLRIPGIAGVVREVDLPGLLRDGDRYINLRNHKLQTDYDWYSERFVREYPGYGIREIMRDVCLENRIEADFWTFPKLLSTPIPCLSEMVAFVPGTTSNVKSWPTEYWICMWKHFSGRNSDVVMLGEPEHSSVVADLIEYGMPHLRTDSIGAAIDVLSSVASVVAVDTGLMHIAVQQGTPTVAIFNNVHLYFRDAQHCRALFGPPCPSECTKSFDENLSFPVDYKEWIWWDGVFDSCKAQSRCMTKVSPEQAIAALNELKPLTRRGFAQGGVGGAGDVRIFV